MLPRSSWNVIVAEEGEFKKEEECRPNALFLRTCWVDLLTLGRLCFLKLKPDLPIFIVSWHSNNAFLSLDGITVDHCLGDLETPKIPTDIKERAFQNIHIHTDSPLKYPQAFAAHGHQTDLKETSWPWCDLFIVQVPILDSIFLQFLCLYCQYLHWIDFSNLEKLI